MQGQGFWPDRWWLNCWLYATHFQIGFNKLSYFIPLRNSRTACSSFLSHRSLPAIHLLSCESFFSQRGEAGWGSGQAATAGPCTSPQASGWWTPVEAARHSRTPRERRRSDKKPGQLVTELPGLSAGDGVKITEGECLSFPRCLTWASFSNCLDFIPAWWSRAHKMLV